MLRNIKQAIKRQDWFAVILELVIVILGIVIASQFNVAQENSRIRKHEAFLERNLKKEVQNNLESMQSVKKYRVEILDGFNQLINWLESYSPGLEENINKQINNNYPISRPSIQKIYLERYLQESRTEEQEDLIMELLQLNTSIDLLFEEQTSGRLLREKYFYDPLNETPKVGRDFIVEHHLTNHKFINGLYFIRSNEYEQGESHKIIMEHLEKVKALLQ